MEIYNTNEGLDECKYEGKNGVYLGFGFVL